MRSFTALFALTLCAFVGVGAHPALAQPSAHDTLDADKLGAVVEWLERDVDTGRVPGAVVLVAQDGEVLLHEAVGWADKDRRVPMALDSVHPIASSTKLVTTVAALRLYEANRLSVMAPIAQYLPELADLKVAVETRDAIGGARTELVAPARQPTVHDLMTHRAGFTYYFHPQNPLRDRYRELGIDRIDRDEAAGMLRKLGSLPLAFEPGSRFEYSIATDLLGHIIERVTRQPLDVALKELVLDPLGMSDTTFHVQGPALARLARPLSSDADPWVFEWVDVTKAPKRFAGGLGLASTAADYFRVLQMLLNEGTLDGVRLLSPATVRWAMSNQISTVRGQSHPGDGYGWGLFNPVRVAEGGPPFPGSVGDLYWGGITGPRYFLDPQQKLIGIMFVQGPSVRAAYHAELRAMVYGALVTEADSSTDAPQSRWQRIPSSEVRRRGK
jgi:CubicO group peptidase (beta-lactamase class C family)